MSREGRAREKWGKLRDDDWDQVAGKRAQLVARLQERYGHAKERRSEKRTTGVAPSIASRLGSSRTVTDELRFECSSTHSSVLVIAIIAAVFGFGLAASAFAGIARILFWLFVIGFVVMMIMHYSRRHV